MYETHHTMRVCVLCICVCVCVLCVCELRLQDTGLLIKMLQSSLPAQARNFTHIAQVYPGTWCNARTLTGVCQAVKVIKY